ncbi:MAG: peptide deformylase, partial [Chloroflexi bacterium]|nr:peptide deformylase [Chloroflexota bacterium]
RRVRRKAKEDLLAQVLEHEIDHLNGTLYIDHLESKDDLIKIEPPEPATSTGGVESHRGD